MRTQLLLALCLITPAALAQSLTEWSSPTLNLRFGYPSGLTPVDPTQALRDGHLTILGISGDSDPTLAAATRCLRPNLLLQAADSTTILLAELDVTCLTPEQQVRSKDLLAQMAELVAKVPGMTAIVQPAWYTIGWQKVHMAAAQGQPQSPDGPAQRVYTMGISTTWNNHLLVWYFSSSSIQTLDRITKSTVRFGRATAAPLYPNPIQDAGPKN